MTEYDPLRSLAGRPVKDRFAAQEQPFGPEAATAGVGQADARPLTTGHGEFRIVCREGEGVRMPERLLGVDLRWRPIPC